MTFLATLLIGIVAGSRSMMAPAAVAWARPARLDRPRSHLGELHGLALGSSPLLDPRRRRARHRPAPHHPQPQDAGAVRRPHRLRRLLRRGARRRRRRAALGLVARHRRRGRRHPRRRGAARAARRLLRLGPAGGADRGRAAPSCSRSSPSASHDAPSRSTPSSSAPARRARRWPCASPAPAAAWRSSSARHLGGTCINTGCTPDQDADRQRPGRGDGPPRRRLRRRRRGR